MSSLSANDDREKEIASERMKHYYFNNYNLGAQLKEYIHAVVTLHHRCPNGTRSYQSAHAHQNEMEKKPYEMYKYTKVNSKIITIKRNVELNYAHMVRTQQNVN